MKWQQIIHFLHIGKTGGTAIKYALAQNLVPDGYTIRMHNHHVKLKDVPKGEQVMFCLRDPINRFVSGFYSRQRQGKHEIYTSGSQRSELHLLFLLTLVY